MFLSFADCDDSINSSRRLLIIIFATSLIFLSIIFTNMFVYLLLNMNKYFIEYPNKDIYVCFDGAYYLVNLKFEHKDEEYLFVQYANDSNSINFAFKRISKLIDKSSAYIHYWSAYYYYWSIY